MWWMGRYWSLAENAEYNCLREDDRDRHTTVRLAVTFSPSVIHTHSLTVVRLSFSVIPSHSTRVGFSYLSYVAFPSYSENYFGHSMQCTSVSPLHISSSFRSHLRVDRFR